MEDSEVGRRIAAARRMAGNISRRQLAQAIDTPGLGEETIKSIEQGRRQLRAHEAPLFADALNVATDFFYGEPLNHDPLAEIEARLERIEEHIGNSATSVRAQLAEQDRILADIRSIARLVLDALRSGSGAAEELTAEEREVLGIVTQTAKPARSSLDQSQSPGPVRRPRAAS